MQLLKTPNMKIPAIRTPSFAFIGSFKKPSFRKPSVSGLALRKPHFAFPPNGRKIAFVSLFSVLIAVCAAVIGLKATTLDFAEDNSDSGFTFKGPDMAPELLGALPLDLYHGPAKTAIVAAVISMFIAFGSIFFAARSLRKTNVEPSYTFRRNAILAHFFNAVVILLAMVAVFTTHGMSSHFDPTYTSRKGGFGEGGMYDRGTFDLETWSCELRATRGAEAVWDDFSRQCRLERAGRFMMIPYLAVGILIAFMAAWDMAGVRRDPGSTVKSELEGYEMS